MTVFVARRLPAYPAVLSSGAFAPLEEDRRRVERLGRIRYDRLGRPCLAYRGRLVPVIAGGSLGALLPARIAESAGTVHYVGGSGASDANAGTNPAAPWETVQHAVDTLTSGQIARVRSGTYTGIKIYHKTNASTITIEADAGATPILRGNGSGSSQCLDIWDSQNWRLRNIEIDGTLSQTCVSVVGNSGDANGYCQNIELYGVDAHDAQQPSNPSGIYIAGDMPTGIQLLNGRSWRNGRRQTLPSSISAGATSIPLNGVTNFPSSGTIWFPDKTTATYSGVSGNSLTGVSGVASGWPAGTILFFHGNTSTGGATLDHGAYYHDAQGLASPDVLMANYLVHDNCAFGMQLYPNAKNVWVVNTDSSYNFNQAGFTFAQTGADGTTGCKFANDVAYMNDPAGHNNSGGFCWQFMAGGATPSNEARYCTSYLNKGSTSSADNIDAAVSGVTVTGNQIAEPTYSTVAAKAPRSADDFRPQGGSPLLGFADPDYCPTFDYAGAAR